MYGHPAYLCESLPRIKARWLTHCWTTGKGPENLSRGYNENIYACCTCICADTHVCMYICKYHYTPVYACTCNGSMSWYPSNPHLCGNVILCFSITHMTRSSPFNNMLQRVESGVQVAQNQLQRHKTKQAPPNDSTVHDISRQHNLKHIRLFVTQSLYHDNANIMHVWGYKGLTASIQSNLLHFH